MIKSFFSVGDKGDSEGFALAMKGLGTSLDSLLNPETGFFAKPKEHWDHWARQLGQRDDDDEGENTQRTLADITTPVTPTEEVDPGLTQTVAPTFVDASASGKRATARSRMATLGYDTRTSGSRYEEQDIDKKRYGTALSRMA